MAAQRRVQFHALLHGALGRCKRQNADADRGGQGRLLHRSHAPFRTCHGGELPHHRHHLPLCRSGGGQHLRRDHDARYRQRHLCLDGQRNHLQRRQHHGQLSGYRAQDPHGGYACRRVYGYQRRAGTGYPAGSGCAHLLGDVQRHAVRGEHHQSSHERPSGRQLPARGLVRERCADPAEHQQVLCHPGKQRRAGVEGGNLRSVQLHRQGNAYQYDRGGVQLNKLIDLHVVREPGSQRSRPLYGG